MRPFRFRFRRTGRIARLTATGALAALAATVVFVLAHRTGLATARTAVAAAPTVSLPAPPANAPKITAPAPAAGFAQQSSPSLSDSTLRSTALAIAASAGDASPTSLSAVAASFRDAAETAAPRMSLPANATGGYAAFLNSTVYLLVIKGNFILGTAPHPTGSPAPTGSVLDVVVDAQTGRIDGYHVDTAPPARLAELGAVRALN